MSPQQDRRSGMCVRVRANESRPAAGADLTSSLTIRPMRKATGPVARAGTGGTLALAYVACVVLANVLTDHLGLVPIGFGLLVTAGTFAAGGTLLARNVSQDVIGRRAVLALMLIGCGLSWWLASPQLAAASAVGFALSESADMAVFTPLRARGWSRAVAVAALVSSTVDTFAFLWLAGFPVTADTVSGQLAVKVGISWLVAAVVALIGARGAVLRQPVYAEGA